MYFRLGLRFRSAKTALKVVKSPKLYFATIGGVLCLYTSKSSQCDSATKTVDETREVVKSEGNGSPSDKPDPVEEFISKYGPDLEKVGFGGIMGICCGVAFKRLSKEAAFTVGLIFMGLQTLSYFGYININYHKVVEDATKALDVDGDGKLTTKDLEHAWKDLRKLLTYNLPSTSGFGVGVALGLYMG